MTWNRPSHIWLTFACCLAVVLAALAWTSRTVLRLDRAAAEAQALAVLEEDVRLALWRCDSWLATLIAQENSQPYFVYSSFYPAARPYARMFHRVEGRDELVASPLLTRPSPYVLLHFQYSSASGISSPQVPEATLKKLAKSASVPAARTTAAAARLAELRSAVSLESLLARLPVEEPQPANPTFVPLTPAPQPLAQVQQRQSQAAQLDRSNIEYQIRAQTILNQAISQNTLDASLAGGNVQCGVFRAIWDGERLLLLRRVTLDAQNYVQGCWLDWPALRETLLSSVRDLLPSAVLEPVLDEQSDDRERMLAALPVRLLPGPAATAAEGASPVELSLWVAWGCALAAAAAVAALLAGVVRLSERRGDFVSAVTHELRTPLTSFRMYAEMLSEGMVSDAQKRQRYLQTLRVEADRLSHLVENVLAYARLERGRPTRRLESLRVGDLLAQTVGRLNDRAEQAGLHVAVDISDCGEALACADPGAVGQILFNLVDNACKYAALPAGGEIQIQAQRRGRYIELRVRDAGPGVPPAIARRLFTPFSKSAQAAAKSAPGVGLGLALSRRLAREMGGDLRLDRTAPSGATFVLRLRSEAL